MAELDDLKVVETSDDATIEAFSTNIAASSTAGRALVNAQNIAREAFTLDAQAANSIANVKAIADKLRVPVALAERKIRQAAYRVATAPMSGPAANGSISYGVTESVVKEKPSKSEQLETASANITKNTQTTPVHRAAEEGSEDMDTGEPGQQVEVAKADENQEAQAKELSKPVQDFLKWASYRLRWGESYTHLFEVEIWDAPHTSDKTQHLDFTDDPNAFKFACIGTTIGGHTLETERVEALDLPLPVSGSIPDTVSFTILDYTRKSIYNYAYAWYLNFYNPHKRRMVSGIAGKYKNIRIRVFSAYGNYHDSNSSEAGINNTYDNVLIIMLYNCIPQGFPGTTYAYSAGNEPFSFELNVTPSDITYDFNNEQSYTYETNKKHLSVAYTEQLEAGHTQLGTIG